MVFVFFDMTMKLEKVTIVILEKSKNRINLTGQKPLFQIFSKILRGGIMKTVTLEVGTPQDTMNDFLRAWHTGKKDETAKIEFSSPEVLWKVLTAKRWELLKALCGAGPISIRETARRVNRDVKGVHTDLTALMSAGIVNRTETGGVEFPFEAVKVAFFLKAA